MLIWASHKKIEQKISKLPNGGFVRKEEEPRSDTKPERKNERSIKIVWVLREDHRRIPRERRRSKTIKSRMGEKFDRNLITKGLVAEG